MDSEQNRTKPDDIRSLLNGLEGWKLAYVYAKSKAKSRTEALREAGIGKTTFYEISEDEQKRLDGLADEIRRNRALMAEPKLNEAAEEAVDVLLALLRARSEYVKLQAALAIIERTLGPVVKRLDATSGGEPITFTFTEVHGTEVLPETG